MLAVLKKITISDKIVLIHFSGRQLTEFRWTPVEDIPVHTKATGKTKLLEEDKQGMLYSSTEPTDKFITENISFETFYPLLQTRTAGGVEENDTAVFYDPRCASLSKMEELSDEEKKTGVIARKIPFDAMNFKIYFENRYGIWTHTMIRI